jgi:hypothetical protein
MPQLPVAKILEEFPFLDDRAAQEPYIYDVLCEIRLYQREGYSKGSGGFATRDTIANSRNIHIPFTPTRDKNIDYLLELLTARYANNISQFLTFEFKFDDTSKKMFLYEKEEFALNLPIAEHEAITQARDEISLGNFDSFIQRFRLFNLDKVVKKSRYQKALLRVIDKGLGTCFFAYRNYYIEKNRIESSEEYCFHAGNYDHVKKSLNLVQFKSVLDIYNELVKNRLRKFGILNTDISDYRDNKIDYILSVLLEDLAGSIPDKDRISIKNFKSLRECILQVDKILDQGQIRNADIVKYIKAHGIVTRQEIISNVLNMTDEIITAWEDPDRLMKEHIIKQADPFGVVHYIDAYTLMLKFSLAFTAIKTEDSAVTAQQKEQNHTRAETFYRAAKHLIIFSTAQTILGGTDQDVNRLAHLIEEYETYHKKLALQAEMAKAAVVQPNKGRPLHLMILSFFSSIFSFFSRHDDLDDEHFHDEMAHAEGGPVARMEPRKETKAIYEKANARSGPIVALSDLIELTPENDQIIVRIIQELRENNMKIVVPIYNARTTLYPKRSKKLLMSDIEYLLVPIQTTKSVDSISEYINSLVGYRIKDEPLPSKGLVAIEKYLRVIYRQKRASQRRKQDQREKNMKP